MLAFTFPGQGSQRHGMGAAWTEHPSPGLARATEEVAAWVSSQLALAELARTRTRVMDRS